MEGTLKEFLLRNPHSFVIVADDKLKDDKGEPVRWSIEWGAAGQLAQQGVANNSLKVGDHAGRVRQPEPQCRTTIVCACAALTVRPTASTIRRTGNRSIKFLGTPTMYRRIALGRIVTLIAITAASSLVMLGQGGRGGRGAGGRGGGPPASAQSSAPLDLTGYWVSLVTEDWRFRMVTPAKGDYASVPISGAGRALADQWDPDKDTAAGMQCKSYGAAGLMRVPTRLHITWADENTLKVETDAGTQTRLLHFGDPMPPADSSLQGFSVASWDGVGRGGVVVAEEVAAAVEAVAALRHLVLTRKVARSRTFRRSRGTVPTDFNAPTPGATGRAGASAVRAGSLKVMTARSQPRPPPQERRAVWSRDCFDRIFRLRRGLRAERGFAADRDHHGGRSRIPHRPVHHQHALWAKLADSGPGWNPTACEAEVGR